MLIHYERKGMDPIVPRNLFDTSKDRLVNKFKDFTLIVEVKLNGQLSFLDYKVLMYL